MEIRYREVKNDWQDRIICFLLPVAYFILVVLFYPFRFVFELDPDEGINLIKAFLSMQGIRLYSEIWSDQPPIFTHILSILFRIFGHSANVARILVLLLSCLLLWAIVRYMLSFWRLPHAIGAFLLIIILPYYTRLSVSVMIGLPAIVFAMLSFLALSYWHLERKYIWLILSAILLGVSVLTKAFTGFLVPIFTIGILLFDIEGFRLKRSWGNFLKPTAIWVAIFSIVTMFMAITFIGLEGIPQLINLHLIAGSSESLAHQIQDKTISEYLIASWPILLLGLVGMLYSIKEKKWTALYLSAWVITSFLLLSNHFPIWYHHQLLVTVPAACLAGIAIGEFMRETLNVLRTRKLRPLDVILVSISLIAIIFVATDRIPSLRNQYDKNLPNINPPMGSPVPEQTMLAIIWDYADQTEMLVTDRPMFAFRTGLSVPPYIAAFTGKRYKIGDLTEDEVLETIKQYKPAQVVLARFFHPIIEEYLKDSYAIRYTRNNDTIYIRRDILLNE